MAERVSMGPTSLPAPVWRAGVVYDVKPISMNALRRRVKMAAVVPIRPTATLAPASLVLVGYNVRPTSMNVLRRHVRMEEPVKTKPILSIVCVWRVIRERDVKLIFKSAAPSRVAMVERASML